MGDIDLVRPTIDKRLEAAGTDCPALHTRVHHNQPTAITVRILQPFPDPEDAVTILIRPDAHTEYWERSGTAVVFEGEIAPDENLATRIEFEGLDPGRTESLLSKPTVERAGSHQGPDRRWIEITPDFVTQRLCQEIQVDEGEPAVIADGGPPQTDDSSRGEATAEPDGYEGLVESVAELEAKLDALEARLDSRLED